MFSVAIEGLEPRTLMAQTIGDIITQIRADVAASKATVAASAKIATADQHTLAADLGPKTKANSALLKILGKDFKASLANIKAMQVRANLIGNIDLNKAAFAVNKAINQKFSAKSLALANKALAKLSADDNAFVSPTVFNAFYAVTATPQTDEGTIGTSNPDNTALTAALPALTAEANFSTALYPQFNALVMDISTFATAITSNYPGTVF